MKNKNQTGITLVALVVTIVVLLILAGVSINLVLGENGLITQAKEAKEQTKAAEANEKESMDSASDWISETVNDTDLPQTKETKPYKPSEEFTKVAGTNLDNGLVIQDADGNQYVWVEVPMTTTVYPTAGLNITEFNDDVYTKIENDLHTYTMTYRNNTNYTDTWHKDTTNPNDWYIETEYNEAKQKMLKSIYQNGGFWVGRYEAGIDKFRNETAETDLIAAQSKENLYPYTSVTRTQAKTIVEQVKYEKYTGSLMFGVQWDLMLKVMEIKQIKENADIIKKLNSNSVTIGNYRNSEFKINKNTKYAVYSNGSLSAKWNPATEPTENYVDNNFNKLVQTTSKNGVLLTTGASKQNSILNIYDVAGNAREFTLEYTNDTDLPCVYRGGGYLYTGSSAAASYRNGLKNDYYNVGVGFRITLY